MLFRSLGIGLNFLDHALEQNLEPPKEPIIFSKATTSVCGPNDDLIIPKNSQKTDWEVEIAFVIGKKGKNIPLQDAESYIFGYCLVCDFSEREWQKNEVVNGLKVNPQTLLVLWVLTLLLKTKLKIYII